MSNYFGILHIRLRLAEIARAIQGVTAGMMMAVAQAIVVGAFPPSERGRALGINATSIAVGLATGPTLGGFIAAYLG
ncbi:MAG: MFS transporter [Methanoculleus sp.]|nr:MFS transporter [Methanoculleus sp.]